MAVAHELAHWILDRGESGLVPSDPMGVYVNWFDEEGYEEDVTPEERADGWAAELLLPREPGEECVELLAVARTKGKQVCPCHPERR